MGVGASVPEPVKPPPAPRPVPVDTGLPKFIPTPVRGDIKITSKGFFDVRRAPNIPPHLTFTLPRGTMLFRAMNQPGQEEDDFRGVRLKTDPTKACLPPTYEVFFYPYPYVMTTIEGNKAPFNRTVVYVTTRNIEILCLVSPSPYSRDSYVNLVKPCPALKEIGCGLYGRSYDPCLTKDYRNAFPDVTGILALAMNDADIHYSALSDSSETLKTYQKHMGVQSGFLTDERIEKDHGYQIEGIPEFILHPFSRILSEPFISEIGPIESFIEKHKDYLNYEVLATLPRKPGDETATEAFMEKALSEEGYNGYHIGIDKQTGFFRVKELSAPFKSADRVVRKDAPEFVFKRGYKFIHYYGGGRRKTRRGRGKKRRTRARKTSA